MLDGLCRAVGVSFPAALRRNLPGFLATAGVVETVAPLWSTLYTYAWFLGFVIEASLYLLLSWHRPERTRD